MKPKHLLALCVLVAGLMAISPLTAQNRAAAQPTEQQKLKDRVDSLDAELRALKEKADEAAKDKARLEGIQKEAKDYYEKAFGTVTKFVDWLVILVAAVPIVLGLFGFGIIDRMIDQAVSKATTDLEKKFDQKLAAELKTLNDSNAVQLKQLEDDLLLRTEFNSRALQGLGMIAVSQYSDALQNFRKALTSYKKGKPRNLFLKEPGAATIGNTLKALKRLNPDQFEENARAELAGELYNDLESELALAALKNSDLTALIKNRQPAPPATPPTSPAATPSTAHESPAPKNPEPASPQDEKK